MLTFTRFSFRIEPITSRTDTLEASKCIATLSSRAQHSIGNALVDIYTKYRLTLHTTAWKWMKCLIITKGVLSFDIYISYCMQINVIWQILHDLISIRAFNQYPMPLIWLQKRILFHGVTTARHSRVNYLVLLRPLVVMNHVQRQERWKSSNYDKMIQWIAT